MLKYARQEMIEGWDRQAVRGGRVLVVGAGTTGNEVIKNLALVGVGRLEIVDSDVVEEVNLSRCVLFRREDVGQPKAAIAARRAAELNPDVAVAGWCGDLVYDFGSARYGDFDCVIATVDNLEARLWVSRYCWASQTPLIDTGIGGLRGNVFVMLPPAESCLECGWEKSEYRQLAERYSCSKLGFGFDEPKLPMVVTTAAFVAAIGVQEAVKILHQSYPGAIARAGAPAGTLIHYDGETGALFVGRVPRRPECPGHGRPRRELPVVAEPALAEPVEQVKAELRQVLGAAAVELWHDREIVYAAVCNHCGHGQAVAPTLLGRFRRYPCPACGLLTMVPGDRSEELRDGYRLSELRVPVRHLLGVVYQRGDVVERAWIQTR